MSSLERAFKSNQRLHRERVNVLGRGFLERKKDYKVRSAEYNRRQNIITDLRKKTLDKNPDEFYFRMKKSRVIDGVHYDARDDEDEMSTEEIRLMQSQDQNYINFKRSIDLNKIEKLQSELHLIDNDQKPKNNHVFFVENEKEKKRFNFSQKMKMDPKLLKMGFNFANPSAIQSVSVEDIEASAKVKALKYRRLENKMQREQFLTTLSEKMQIKKQLLNKKESVKKISKGTADKPPVYKWKMERKK